MAPEGSGIYHSFSRVVNFIRVKSVSILSLCCFFSNHLYWMSVNRKSFGIQKG